MRVHPERFTRKWWLQWHSGAIERSGVFFGRLADELLERRKLSAEYYDEDVAAVRAGNRLQHWTRGFLDLTAVVAHDLRLSLDEYDLFVTQLVGKPASEADKVWSEADKAWR